MERLKALGLNVDRKHLNKILQNIFYCGYIKHALLGDEIIKGKHEPLIDESIYNKVNGLSNAGYEHREVTDEFPLKRHVVCSDCGGYLTGYTVKARGRNYYKCNKKGCKSNHSTDKMHQKYTELLNGYKIPQELIPVLIDVLRKVFKDNNDTKEETRRMLLKRKTECSKKLEKLQVRYGLGEISDEVYQTTLKHLNTELAEISRGLEEASKNLSNMVKFVDEAVAMSCKLGTLWNSGNFENRQSLQKLLFPTGILYNKENDGYRTDNENEVFKIFRRLSVSYEDKKEKATSEIIRLSPSVGKRRLERPTPTSRT